MVRVSPALRSVNSGELSELMHGRPDFVRYQNGLAKCRGFIVLPEGPATRIPGTKMIGEIAGSGTGRLMAFIFKDEDAILLEWTDSLLRFWRGGDLIQSGGSPYSIATPYAEASLQKLQSLQSSDRIYLTEGSTAPQRLSRMALNDWSIEPTPFTNGPFLSRNTEEDVEIGVSGNTGSITLTASADLFVPGHIGVLFKLQQVDQIDAPVWTGETPVAVGDQMYYNGNLYEVAGFDVDNGTTGPTRPVVTGDGGDPETFTVVSAAGGPQWSRVGPGTVSDAPEWVPNEPAALSVRYHVDGHILEIDAFDVSGRKSGVNPPAHTAGRYLAEKGGVVWRFISDGSGTVRITAVSTPRSATALVEKLLPDGLVSTPTYRWSEGAWSSLRGWPRALGAFEQRHIYGGTPDEPRTIWATVIGGTVDMSANGLDDDGFSYILESPRRRAGEIRWIRGVGETLHIGTSGDEFFGSATDADRAFGPQTARFNSDTATGSADFEPISVSGQILFVHKNLRRIIAQAVDPQSGKFRSDALTSIARHILGPGCEQVAYQEEPIPIVWARLSNGALAGMTFAPSEQVIGWHSHTVAAGGFVENIEVMPTDDGSSEDLYLIVRRTIQGVDRRFLEVMQQPFVDMDGSDRPLADAWHQFCAIRYQGEATTTISGLAHLEGEAVTAWTELGAVSDLVVTSGSVELPRAVTSAIVGLDATAEQVFETLDLVVGQPDGGDEGRLRTHRRTGIRLFDTAGGIVQIVGTSNGDIRESDPERIFGLDAFNATMVKTGVFEAAGGEGWDYQKRLRVRPEPGAPITVASMASTIMIGDS